MLEFIFHKMLLSTSSLGVLKASFGLLYFTLDLFAAALRTKLRTKSSLQAVHRNGSV